MKPRKPWRKLWRVEPAPRSIGCSIHARSLLTLLIRYAEDDGRLCPVPDATKRRNPAAGLAALLGVDQNERRAFYRVVDELLAYGDDGEPGCLVIQDDFLTLTGFEICQANRSPTRHQLDRNSTATRPQLDTNSTPTRPQLDMSHEPKPSESPNPGSDLAAYRDGEVDGDRERASEESEEASKQPDDPSIALPSANALPRLLEDYRSRWATRYPKKRPLDVERYEHELADALSKAEQEQGDTDQVLHHALDAFFADEGQEQYRPGHVPKGLVYNWDRYLEPYREQLKQQVRERRDARYQRELEEAGQRRLAKALGNGAPTDPEEAKAVVVGLVAGIGRTV